MFPLGGSDGIGKGVGFWKNRNIANIFIIHFGNVNTLYSFTKINHVT